MKIVFIILAILVSISVEAKDFRDNYKDILEIKCAILIDEKTDERAIAWRCPLERTKKLKALELELEEALTMHFKDTNNITALDVFQRLNNQWDEYSKQSADFDLEFHVNGSMGTSGRIKSELALVKKRIEILLDYIYGYYDLDL